MKSSQDYSEQELARMSWEELVAHLRLLKEAQLTRSVLIAPCKSSTPPMQAEALRLIGGL